MDRARLQHLAAERAADAESLLAAGRWSGAYYLAGYAVECGLKACIAKMTNQYDFPDRDRAQRAFTHRLDTLLDVAGLKPRLDTDRAANPALDTNWQTAKLWSEAARYDVWTEAQARGLVAAVTDPTTGVLPWITARW